MKSESEVAQLCPTLSDSMDCSLPGSSIHGIFQARVLEWGAIAFSKHIHTSTYKRDNHNGVVTHLEPDMLECEVKRVLLLLLLLSHFSRVRLCATP